jgi:hypothetical protein
MINCGHACPYNTLTGCKVKEYDGICPLSNMASTPKPMTNAEKIRAMTDEELAIEMFVGMECGACPCAGKCGNGSHCKDTILEWLKQPAEVDNAENH